MSKNISGFFLTINAGSNEWNYRILDLANAVKNIVGDVEVSINEDAVPDKRSYKVDFSNFKKLASKYKTKISLNEAVEDLHKNLKSNI